MRAIIRGVLRLAMGLSLSLGTAMVHAEANSLLNASYDVSREFYKDFNALFARQWERSHGVAPIINQSHGPSTKQTQAVINGLGAAVVTLNQALDMQALVERGLIRKDWRSALPHGSVPFYSTTVFVVRKGNPRRIRDWGDLIRPGISVVLPNPKTSGNGRYSYLSAWSWALQNARGDGQNGEQFLTGLFRNVPVLDAGGRAATTTFAQREIGDVLLTFENEVYLIDEQFGRDKFEIVYPSSSIKAELPVALVEPVADKEGNRALAQAWLQTLFSPAAQHLAARHFLRPADPAVLAQHKTRFRDLRLIDVESELGGWGRIQELHFKDGAIFDRITRAARAPAS